MLQDVKDYLKITWDNENAYLEKVIGIGKEYLQGLTGAELKFEKPKLDYILLLDYCRYYYNNAIEYFEENFRSQIVRLQYTEAIKAFKAVDNEG